jgi:hypothetical protein
MKPIAVPPPLRAAENNFTAEGAPPPGQVGADPHEPVDEAAPELRPAPSPLAVGRPAADPSHVPETGSATQPVSRKARIVGDVEVRQGDGSLFTLPRQARTVQITALDATISWVDADTHGLAAMPLVDFDRHLLARDIEFVDAASG